MKTPICDFVKKYANSNPHRFHMPGHNGQNLIGFENMDITEITGADVLYNANGIIAESEQNAGALFGTKATFYSCEGSSLCIRAMLYLLKQGSIKNAKNTRILAGRNAHKSFVTTAALLDIDVDWIYGKNSILSLEIDTKKLEKTLKNNQYDAVYITSPDYLGNVADIQTISKICKKHNTLLLVDNAHGAYLKFLKKSLHPIDLGADICCDSAHKTLPVLTGGAYLHISKNAPDSLFVNAQNALSQFASTSPSYLILQSLDMVNNYLENDIKNDIERIVSKVRILKDNLKNNGFLLVGNEPLKLTVNAKKVGFYGTEIAEILEKNNMICEFCDPDYIVFMFSAKTDLKSIDSLEEALLYLEKRTEILEKPPVILPTKSGLKPSKVIFLKNEKIEIENAVGRILATPTVNCPPAVPIAVCGEIMTENTVECFKYYGIQSCFAVKE